jgi:hypothetical protein
MPMRLSKTLKPLEFEPLLTFSMPSRTRVLACHVNISSRTDDRVSPKRKPEDGKHPCRPNLQLQKPVPNLDDNTERYPIEIPRLLG